MLKRWEELPEFLRCAEVKPYYDILAKKRFSLALKRVFDVLAASVLLLVLGLPMIIVAVLIKMDSEGPVLFRQERVTTYGRKFRIHKFRTMVDHAEQRGSSVTVSGDRRVTKVGGFLRKYRVDEFPQLFDVLAGDMSFVGTRPESPKYVMRYTNEMRATLLLPAGITSEASIRYKDEARLLDGAEDVDKVYVEAVLPGKMKWNLLALWQFSFIGDIQTMFRTVLAVCGKEYGIKQCSTEIEREK